MGDVIPFIAAGLFALLALVMAVFGRHSTAPTPPRTKKKVARGGAWLAICISAVSGFEGVRTYVYRDPVGIPTYCFGETTNPEWGRKYTMAECKNKLIARLQEFADGVERCVKVDMSPSRKAAMVSFAYNVGSGAFCRSTLVRKINTGDPTACDELSRWTYAKGIQLPGLVKRRADERRMCNA